MELHLVHDPRYARVTLAEPTRRGYLYAAATVQRPAGPLALPSRARARLLADLRAHADALAHMPGILRAVVFRAVVRPPTSRLSAYLQTRGARVQVADFDVIVLVEAVSLEVARDVRASRVFETLVARMRRAASTLHVVTAHNARRIGDVDTSRDDLFLFNHFAADDPRIMPSLWEHLADWYVKETGLRNSVALVPDEGEKSDYAIINWASWDVSPARHFWHQLSKRSFWRYVVANLDANRAASMPIYCRRA